MNFQFITNLSTCIQRNVCDFGYFSQLNYIRCWLTCFLKSQLILFKIKTHKVKIYLLLFCLL